MKYTYSGIDANLKTSLFEYQLILANEEHEDGSCTHHYVYKISEDAYGQGHISEAEVNRLLNGEDWASKETLRNFFNWIGEDSKEYEQHYIKNHSLINKLHDLMSYFGHENIFGTTYLPLTKLEVTKIYLNEQQTN